MTRSVLLPSFITNSPELGILNSGLFHVVLPAFHGLPQEEHVFLYETRIIR